MQKIPRVWLVFVVAEGAAVVAWATYRLFDSGIGPVLWGLQLILLMPGSVVSELLVERTLWMSGVPLRAMTVFTLVAALVVNAAVWYVLLEIWRRAWRPRAP